MLNRMSKPLLFAIALGAPGLAFAAWTGKGEVGAALSTANTGAKNTTFTAKIDLAAEVEKWKHAFGGSTLYTSSKAEASASDPNPDDKTSAKRWEVHEQSDYKFTDRMFWFGAVRHEDDDIGSFEHQSAVTTGVGYKVFDSDATKLSAQVGVGYKRFKQRSALDNESDAIATGLVNLTQVLTSTTQLIDKLSVESGSSNTLVQNDLAVQVKMTDVLAMSAGYQIRYNTQPGPRTFGSGEYAHTDRLLTLNLVYEFK